ncbi:polysaccharide biosynthesis protein [Alkalibacterium pelagium]|uniref:NDP-sugar epimerase, includes UDP-GlcNAc-inverting 4,6-dehydratase FlaA1 and capsular polysaccharide biosynthesis protein EpsC n=1 Tax=Alkalibacterium pelagium TaxID=426702 RepID=A0A1H7NPU0_9LACT|nr:nucleoside-diphosphate sugar epimerase/dehydratase [Alkalibacterium pelagium]GEN51422.1 short-chain dehydrogenase [Alkalibacterium pelagium]SEL25038.1 NDP-sugar epimerase, includes UDP-GlcNAc-inverting 4,6-dehydratase FlaA1 and capsular polysaccharide biosynthesis protein EpsC [Alkalibacterium pelagium]
MNRNLKRYILSALDTFFIIFSCMFAYFFLIPYINLPQRSYIFGIILLVLIYNIIATKTRMFDRINRYTSIKETLSQAGVVSAAFLIGALLTTIVYRGYSLRVLFLSYIVAVSLITGSRVLWRIYVEHKEKLTMLGQSNGIKPVKTLIVGAGAGGSLFIRHIKNDPAIELVGIVDDDSNKGRTILYGVPVIGTTKDIDSILVDYDVEQITVAIPSLLSEKLEKLVHKANEANIKINQMPSVEDIVSGEFEVNTFKEIDVTDLLGREEVKLDMEKISTQLSGQTILISGAGGSIGSEIARQVIRFSPTRLLLLGHGEYSIYLIEKELRNLKHKGVELIPIIADIQDRDRIFEVMEEHKPDRVYHAAAHKHVPLMEYNPREAVKNNIYGTKNMAEAAKAADVKSFVMISTDKAVNPPNVMGATKRIAEMIVTGLNEKGKTNFVAVRFGNVLNSRGSVIPLFKDQIKNGGPITLTDFRMTRYFMTIPEASRLVIQAGSLAKGGEIFVLDMGKPVRIYDLAKKMIKLSGQTEADIQIKETGIRPGEKLFEELLTSDESTHEQVFEKIFVGEVTNSSVNDVLEFVKRIEMLSEEELKKELISYANKNTTDQETGREILKVSSI